MARPVARLFISFMKTVLVTLRALALATACILISSCVAYDDGYYSSGVEDGGSYSDHSAPYDGGSYPPPRPVPAGTFTTGYYHSHGGYRHDDPRVDYYRRTQPVQQPRDHDGRLDKNNLRIVGGPLGGKTKPEGVHSADWYRDRGYNLNKLKVEDKDGTPYRSSSARPDKDDKPSRSSDGRRANDDDNHHKGGPGKR